MQSLYEVWGEGSSWEEMEASIRGGLPGRDPAHLAADASWCIRVDGFGCGVADPVATLNRLSFVPFQGPVQLRDPDNRFRLIQVPRRTWHYQMPCVIEPIITCIRWEWFTELHVGSVAARVLVSHAIAATASGVLDHAHR